MTATLSRANALIMPLFAHGGSARDWIATAPDYGVIVLDSDEVPIDRPCEDCGGLVLSGLEPFAPGDDPELEAGGLTAAGSEWCTNLDCPSNHVLRGLTRVGVNDYICTVCGEALRAPMSAVRAHRAMH